MIDELRIKCPSCGVVLEVKNSRHEATKRIVCPKCKKALAVDFREKTLPQLFYGTTPLGLAEGINKMVFPGFCDVVFNVARISDGSYKCSVRALSDSHPLLLNGQPQEQDDEVVLTTGDELQVDNTVLIYGRPGSPISPTPSPTPPSSDQTPRNNGYWLWGLATIATAIGVVLLMFLLRPKGQPDVESNLTEEIIATPAPDTLIEETKEIPPVKKDDTPKVIKKESPSTAPALSQLSNYELEQRAGKGDVSAQCEIGKRYIGRGDSAHMELGKNYLRMAAGNGSSEARRILNSLQ